MVQIAEGFGEAIHIVWGDNDEDQWLLTEKARRFPHVAIHGAQAELEIAGRFIRANHYYAKERRLKEAKITDIVCYGHDHIAHN